MEKKEILRQLRTDVVLNKKVMEDLEKKASMFKKIDDARGIQETLTEIKNTFVLWKKNLDAQKTLTRDKEVLSFIEEIKDNMIKVEKELIKEYDESE